MLATVLKTPKVPTVKSVDGWWAYSMQGVMRAENPLGKSEDPTQHFPAATGFTVNLASYAPLLPVVPPGMPPQPPSVALNPPPMIPELTGWRPVDFVNPYSSGSQAGYYPFSEIGYLLFGPSPTIAHAVSGWFRINVGGYDSNDNIAVKGAYLLDANTVTGVFTVQLTPLPQAIWDYHFVIVDKDNILVHAAGRLPRPAVASGKLRRMK